jgi:hypothetical protein
MAYRRPYRQGLPLTPESFVVSKACEVHRTPAERY